jgi:hypothetical protein
MYNPQLTIRNNKGFTLMLAVLVASLLMSLGLSMFNIAQKEIILSTVGRDSQFAFYAADTGSECALYWDFLGAFSVGTTTATCAGYSLGAVPAISEGGPFDFEFVIARRYCSIVTINKNDSFPNTEIIAKGYNTRCSDTTSRRRLEREVKIKY